MSVKSTPFELHILKRMSAGIRASVLDGMGVASGELERVEASCPIRLPDPDLGRRTRIALYEELLGRPVLERVAAPPSQPGTTEHAFLLPSWPHLFWVVREAVTGETFSIGFENQCAPPARCLKPQCLRPELVTLALVKRVAPSWKYHDGWDEDVTIRFEFEEGTFEGRFVWELLQEWRRIEGD